MADNITAPAAGVVLATDEIGSVHYPRTKISIGADGSASDVSGTNPLPVSIIAGGVSGGLTNAELRATPVAVTGTFFQATQPVSIAGAVSVTGPLTDAQLRATAVPISVAALPLPTGAATATGVAAIVTALGTPLQAGGAVTVSGVATAANQATEIAAINTIGTRAYAAGIARLAYSGTSAQSAAITATEVMVHNCGAARCFVAAGAAPVATTNDIPIEAGEKFTLRITSGHKIAALQDTAAGNLNIVPVA